jgi:hypothetical protein
LRAPIDLPGPEVLDAGWSADYRAATGLAAGRLPGFRAYAIVMKPPIDAPAR